MLTRRRVPFADARATLDVAVAAARTHGPLAPVRVVTPNRYAQLILRRDLAVNPGGTGAANLRCSSLTQIAGLYGAPELDAAGLLPLGPELTAEATRRALAAAAPGTPLSDASDHPATLAALGRTFRELRRAGEAATGALTSGSRTGLPGAVASAFEEYRALTAGFYDATDLAVSATRVAARGEADELGAVVVHLPERLGPADLGLLEALGKRMPVDVIEGVTTDQAPADTRLLDAPGRATEVRAGLRLLLRDAEAGEVALRSSALLYRRQEYARIAQEVLDEAGIPWYGPAAGTLRASAAGRFVTGLLTLADHDVRRDEVIAWLAGAPVLRSPGRGPAPADRWNVYSREAGVVSGPRQWHDRLERAATRAAQRGDADGAHARRELAEFVTRLERDLGPPRRRDWTGWSRKLLALWTRYLGAEGVRAGWVRLGAPPEEVQAAAAIEQAIQGLRALDTLPGGGPVTADGFRRAVFSLLDRPAGHRGRTGDGVLVGPLGCARGLSLDYVVVFGLVEGEFPPAPLGDVLLPDRVRRALGLPDSAGPGRREEERATFEAALGAGRLRVLCRPRADLRAGRATVPSPWFAAAGRDGVAPPAESLPSFAALVDAGAPFVAAVDRALAGGPAGAPAPRAEDDGLVGPGPHLPADDHTWSATTLEDYATCPRRYLLGKVLSVREVELPEDLEDADPRTVGLAVHDVLEQFVHAHPRRAPDDPWSDAERAALDEIVESVWADVDAHGRAGHPVLWSAKRRRVRRVLRAFLDADEEWRAMKGVVPLVDELEAPFGPDTDTRVDVTTESGRTLTFRGRIDRIDASPDRRLLAVTDYKTGGDEKFRAISGPDPLARGTCLQLALYAHAARARHADDAVELVRSEYAFTDRYGRRRGYPVDDDVDARLRRVLSAVTDSIGDGVFPTHPGPERGDRRGASGRTTFTNCKYCAYDRVCPTDRDDAWARVRARPEAAGYVELAEGDVESSEDEP